MRTILKAADFILPFIPLLILGQRTMDAFPLTGGERSWAGVLAVVAVVVPLFAWGAYTASRLLGRGPARVGG